MNDKKKAMLNRLSASGINLSGSTAEEKLQRIEEALNNPKIDRRDIDLGMKYIRLYSDIKDLTNIEKMLKKLEKRKL